MSKQTRQLRKVLLLSGEALAALNELLPLLNSLLTEDERIMLVKTRTDISALRQKIKKVVSTKKPLDPGHQNPAQADEGLQNALSTIATNIWRARNKIVDSETGEVKDEMKRIYRHVEAVFDALSQIGVDIKDMQGRLYDSGMALKVISFEPTPGLTKEEITETIRPTITYKDQLIQIGEVIIGTPHTK